MTKSTKKILVVAAVAAMAVLVYKWLVKSKEATPVVLGDQTLSSPESTITIGPPSIKPASKSWSAGFADSLEEFVQ